MGIDYSISLGYGIAIPEDEIPDVLKSLDDCDPYDEGVIGDWLKAEGFEYLGYTYGGDFMSGPSYLFFYVKSTYFRGESHYLDTLYEFSGVPEPEGYFEMGQLAYQLGLSHNDIGWKLISNVS